MEEQDEKFMRAALRDAEKAFAKGEAPIGAVAVVEGKVVARAHNLRESTHDPLGHAELILLKKLSRKFRSWRFPEATVYVTLEPCVMCVGALMQSRVKALIFGAPDPKAGACGSVYDLPGDRKLPHRMRVHQGLLVRECSAILSNFFFKLRGR